MAFADTLASPGNRECLAVKGRYPSESSQAELARLFCGKALIASAGFG
jgi:hypothetical protein